MSAFKNIYNQSGIITTNLSTTTIENVNRIFENTLAVVENTTTTPWYPYTLDYSLGSIFYIPTNYATASNFNIIINNIPTDITKSYTLTLIYYQSSNMFYCNGIRCLDTSNSYILGTSSTFGTPLFNGGTPTLANTPNLIIQQFSILSLFTSASVSSRYITTSVSNNY